MTYRLLVMDLDNTLLDKNLQIAPAAKDAVQAAQDKGVIVTLATGRMFRSARMFAEELNLPDLPLITYNGALIKTFRSAKTLFHEPLPPETTRELIFYCKNKGHYLMLFIDDQIIVEQEDERTRSYTSISKIEVVPIGDFTKIDNQSPTKALIFEDQEQIAQLEPLLKDLFASKAYVTRSYPFFLEIMNPVVSKGKALAWLGAYLGVKQEEIIAIGDSYNDLDMIEYAGLGVAMGHAPDPVKRRANYVTGAVETGVSDVIKRFILNP